MGLCPATPSRGRRRPRPRAGPAELDRTRRADGGPLAAAPLPLPVRTTIPIGVGPRTATKPLTSARAVVAEPAGRALESGEHHALNGQGNAGQEELGFARARAGHPQRVGAALRADVTGAIQLEAALREPLIPKRRAKLGEHLDLVVSCRGD